MSPSPSPHCQIESSSAAKRVARRGSGSPPQGRRRIGSELIVTCLSALLGFAGCDNSGQQVSGITGDGGMDSGSDTSSPKTDSGSSDTPSDKGGSGGSAGGVSSGRSTRAGS